MHTGEFYCIKQRVLLVAVCPQLGLGGHIPVRALPAMRSSTLQSL